MPPPLARSSRRFAVCLLLVSALLAAGDVRSQEPTPRERLGGLISIPGTPLPPTEPDAVRTAIALFEPFMSGYRLFGTNRSVGRGYGYLATLYSAIGEHARAAQLFDDAQKRLEQSGTKLEVAWLNNNRGLGEAEQKLYASSLRSYRRALAALTAKPSLVSPRAIVLQNLAATQQLLGDVEAAEDAYLEALELLRRAGKEDEATFQTTRANLALLYCTLGDYATAREILGAVLEQKTISRALRFAALNDLAAALSELNDFGQAAGRFNDALALTGEGSMDRAIVLTNLAALRLRSGDFEQAQRVGKEALRVLDKTNGETSRSAAAIDATLGAAALGRGDLINADVHLTRARNVFSREIGDREALAHVTRDLALVAQRRGQADRALALGREALDLDQVGLDRILAFGSEAQRLAYRSKASPYDQLANLGDAAMLSEAVLTMKGAVLESLLRERALSRKSASRENRERLDRIHALKVELMESISRADADIERLQRELKSEEMALAKILSVPTLGRQIPRPTLARVQSALHEDQALIEIIRFVRYESNGVRRPWYGALIIARGRAPAWVVLGPADRIEASISSLLSTFGDGNRGAGRIDAQNDVSVPLRDLHEALWEPLAKALPDCSREIYVSPDGATHFVPWATLLDKRMTFVAEQWRITLIGSGRDLLRSNAVSESKSILALGYGLDDLPYTRSEVEELARQGKATGWQATVLLGDDASEATLFAHPHPRILHFATHAGQLDAAASQAIERRLSRNPMYRGYLYLGGAQNARNAWSNDSASPFFDDGILTAEEAAGLDLNGTWLTVLSACRTGFGDAASGEGVLGLRRGFTLAGTEYLLFSLWPVNDRDAAAFMSAFYETFFRTRELPLSFQETQLRELRRLKETEGIRAAVQRAGAFAVTR